MNDNVKPKVYFTNADTIQIISPVFETAEGARSTAHVHVTRALENPLARIYYIGYFERLARPNGAERDEAERENEVAYTRAAIKTSPALGFLLLTFFNCVEKP